MRLNFFTITDKDIPQEFDGKEIVFISDIHCGAYFSKGRFKDLVGKINEINPDMVLIGGDYITRGIDNIEPCIEVLEGLSPEFGVFSVLGNHDNWGDKVKTRKALEEIDISVLTNQGVWVKSNNSKIRIGGVGDLWTDTQDIQPVLENTSDDDFIILLSHNPMYVEKIRSDSINLVLSGHTHGGQFYPIRFIAPFMPSRLKSRYVSGSYQMGDTRLIVTNGIGTIFIPGRLFTPPEIVVVKLMKE